MAELAVVKELSGDQFDNVIRFIKRSAVTRIGGIKTSTAATLERLGKKPNPAKAVAGTPDGSDQGNVRSIQEWLDKVQPGDRKAIRQVVAIDATAAQRIEG